MQTRTYGGGALARRKLLLATTALISLALLPAVPRSVDAACNVTGSGVLGALNSGDSASCTGLGNSTNVAATGATNVTVTIGDGSTPTSLAAPAGAPANLDSTTASSITVTNQASIQTPNNGIILANGANNNTVSIQAGGLVQTANVGAAAISISDSNNNTVNVAGTVNPLNSQGIEISGASTGNVINILQGGSVTALSNGINLLTGGNTLNNAGTIAAGNGVLSSNATDTIINSGTITGGGGTAVNLRDGNDSLTLAPGSTITGNVIGGTGTDTLGFGGTGTASFDLGLLGSGLQYSEFEQLEKTGSSTWTLTGGTTYNGPMTVTSGTLLVNGTLSSLVTVNGGILGGAGTVDGLIVNSGGTVAPGNSIGTTNVSNNVTFNAGSTYQVEINNAGQSDLINATGTATINGGTVQVIPLGTGFLANTQYTILTAAGGVTGTFSALAPLPSPLVSGLLTYDANNVYFMLQQVAGFGTLGGLTPNQFAAGNTLDQALAAGTAGPIANAINTLAALDTGGIKSGLDDLAGQVLADSRRFTVDQAAGFQGMMWKAGTQLRGESMRVTTSPVSSYAPTPRDPVGKALAAQRPMAAPSVWFGGYGAWDRASATDIAFGTSASNAGGALGVDLWATPASVGGFAVGASSGKLKSSGRADSVEADAGHGGLYARGEVAGFTVASAISYSFAALESSRAISFLQQTATGSWRAHTVAASLGVSRAFVMAGMKAEPFANLDWYATRHTGLTETGAPGVNQIVQDGTHDLFFGTAGIRFTHDVIVSYGSAGRIGATFAVRQDFSGGTPNMTTAFEGASGIPFVITGVERTRTTALAGAEAVWNITDKTSFKATYEGEFASGFTRHGVQGVMRIGF